MKFGNKKALILLTPLLVMAIVMAAFLSLLIPAHHALAQKYPSIVSKSNKLLANHEVELYSLVKNGRIKSTKDSDGDGIIDYFDDGSKNNIKKVFKIRAIKPFNDEFDLTVTIPEDRLNYYKKLDLPEIKKDSNFPYLATSQDPVLNKIVSDLGDLYLENYDNGNKYYLLHSILEVGRDIRYESDKKINARGEYWKFPVETLASSSGDCEDTTLLMAGLFKNAGFDVILVDFKTHIGLGLALDDTLLRGAYGDNVPLDYYEYKGVKYYYLETTNLDNYHLGEIPSEFKKVKPMLYEVK